jgi:hypothetical protein
MDFTRGQSPKDAMNIGAKKIALGVDEGSYYINDNEFELSPRNLPGFLESLETLSLPNDPIYGPQEIRMETFDDGEDEYCTETTFLHEIAGKVLKYDDVFYQMPTLDEIVVGGFVHLLMNELQGFIDDGEDDYEASFRKLVSKMDNPIELPEKPRKIVVDIEAAKDNHFDTGLFDPGKVGPFPSSYDDSPF